MGFEIKDSGQRKQMAGMVRDVADDKIKYHLVFDGPMLERWAAHLTKGAKKYSERNWMGARTEEERARFIESAVRHFVQWLRGDRDEDHAAAVLFNINGAEYVQDKLDQERGVKPADPAGEKVCLEDEYHYRNIPGSICAACGCVKQ